MQIIQGAKKNGALSRNNYLAKISKSFCTCLGDMARLRAPSTKLRTAGNHPFFSIKKNRVFLMVFP